MAIATDPAKEHPPVHEITVYLPHGAEQVIYLGTVALVRSVSEPTGFHVVTYPTKGFNSMGYTCTCRYYQVHGTCPRHIEAATIALAMERHAFEEAYPNGLL